MDRVVRKKQALEGLVTIFDPNKKSREKDYEAEIRRLKAKIGELVVERDFFIRNLQEDLSLEEKRQIISKEAGLSLKR